MPKVYQKTTGGSQAHLFLYMQTNNPMMYLQARRPEKP